MIQKFVDRFIASESTIRAELRKQRPENYNALVERVVKIVGDDSRRSESPDPARIHVIDDGDYQGTLLFIIGAKGYQPRT